jgi:hypothetical protein
LPFQKRKRAYKLKKSHLIALSQREELTPPWKRRARSF